MSLPILDSTAVAAPVLREGHGPLMDTHGRTVRYLRLSITDRCDLRCVYCMPEAGNPMSERSEVLSIEETVRAVGVFQKLGVVTVRITGGEPLVRRGVVELVAGVRSLGISDIALSTNATRLHELARPLRDAGVRRVNISLDTLRPERLADVSRRGEHEAILRGIDAAVEVGFEERKFNTVLMRGVNGDEAEALVRFAWSKGFTPRFIELMPVGEGAALVRSGHHLGNDAVRQQLRHLLADGPDDTSPRAGRGPARYVRARESGTQEVGFISAMTHNFCDGCNRVRLSTKGELRPCLGSPRGVSLRDLMRAGASDETLAAAVRGALDGKEPTHHFLDATRDDHLRVTMSGIGG